MPAPPLTQPPPAGQTLDRFASATVDLLGADGTTTLREHLAVLADIAGVDLVLLYHGGIGTQAVELVAAFGVPDDAVAALRHDSFDEMPAGAWPAPGDSAPSGDDVDAALAGLGIRGRWNEPLWTHGGCIGRLVFGSRRWDVFAPGTVAVFAAAGTQIALVLRTRLAEGGDAEAASSPDVPAAASAEPPLFRRRRDRFIALLAHELRNPVAPVRSGLDLLLTDRLDAAAREATVRMMQRQVAQLVHLIDDFLDTARLNTGRLRAQRRPVRLLPTLETAIESVGPAVRSRAQRIERTGHDDATLVVDADPVRLTQVFATLLAACAAATPPAGALRVTVDVDADTVTLSFADQGPPIAELDAAALFDPFSAPPGKEGDTGFGLLRSLLALNDGRVAVRNRPGGLGRVFEVRLRLVGAAAAAPAEPADAPALGGRRVLVVDDNLDAAESLGLLLGLDGHDVRLAHDGPAAVAAATTFEPEIILMDLGLPGFSGHEAIARIRDLASPTRPGIVALTGWGTRADRDASARAGADVHLVKPVARAVLVGTMQTLLQPSPPPVSP